jgi:hypothetical protein
MKTKTYLTAALLAASLIGGLLITGCGSTTKVSTTPGESVGKQLIDLEQAYKDGDISKEQYEKLQKKLVNKND